MPKNEFFTIRLSNEDREHRDFYAISVGYEDLSKFVRDSINGLIKAKQKPSREVVIIGE